MGADDIQCLVQLGSHLARLSRFQWFYETAASRSGATSADDILCVGAAWLALARLFTLLLRFVLRLPYLMCGGAWLLIVSYVSAAMCSGACSLSSLTAFDCGTVCWSAALMGIRWRFQVDTLEVSGSFGSGPLSVIPFCHRIPITHGATSTTPSTREVAYERQEIDNRFESSLV